MKYLLLILLLIGGLTLSAQSQKAYRMEDGTIRLEKYHSNGQIEQISFHYNNTNVGTWLRYDEKGSLVAKAIIENGKPTKIYYYEEGFVTIVDNKQKSITKMKI